MTATDEPEREPPSAKRVARRAFALSAVVCRGHLDLDPQEAWAQETHTRLIHWIERLDLWPELEPKEAELVKTSLGTLAEQDQIDATWRSEGVVVLGWALYRTDIPGHDEQVDPQAVTADLDFLQDEPELLASARRRDIREIDRLAERMFALHWRLRDFSLRAGSMDFSAFARDAWFGPLDISGLPLAKNDLAICGRPIAECDQGDFHRCLSTARERHQAANWLRGDAPIYSHVGVDT